MNPEDAGTIAELLDVLAAVDRAYNAGDAASMADRFVRTGVLDDAGVQYGPSDFSGYLRAQQAPGEAVVQRTGQSVVEPHESSWRARSFLMRMRSAPLLGTALDPVRISWTGYTTDEFARDADGTWRVTRRCIRPWHGEILHRFDRAEQPR